MIVAGVMSGTSADGINVAFIRISGASQPRLIGHIETPYSKPVRQAILAAMNAKHGSVADLSRLNFLLGGIYADAVTKAQRKFRVKLDLVGCHGQTIYHQGDRANFLGQQISTTWQTGEGAVLAERLRVPVVSDFRPADMAAGGKGAPLVPFFDYLMFRHPRMGRIVQNIGGIANLTVIRANASSNQVLAFDTGPGNMVIDAVTAKLFGMPYDRNGQIAASGRTLPRVVDRILSQRFFTTAPPKTAGREEFGSEFVTDFLRLCGNAKKQDVVATATALTASSIGHAMRKFVLKKRYSYQELIVSGGGTRNSTLMAMLANEVEPLGLKLRFADEFGVPSEAKEAMAFAVLAYQTWRRRPSNIPSATGARHPAILGKISYV